MAMHVIGLACNKHSMNISLPLLTLFLTPFLGNWSTIKGGMNMSPHHEILSCNKLDFKLGIYDGHIFKALVGIPELKSSRLLWDAEFYNTMWFCKWICQA